jgi:HSP20 family molecular chaperone IbpA
MHREVVIPQESLRMKSSQKIKIPAYEQETCMGSRKLDLRSAPINYDRTVTRFFNAAFGPSPSLYRQISLCGWRPLIDHRKHHQPSVRTRPNKLSPAKTFSSGIEVYETPEGMTIEVALSVIREESLHLAVSGEKVIIRGERIIKETQRKTIEPMQCRPFFRHAIALPSSISPGAFRAQLEGDIVRIDFAKRSSA